MEPHPKKHSFCTLILTRYIIKPGIPWVSEYKRTHHTHGGPSNIVEAILNSDLNLAELIQLAVVIKGIKQGTHPATSAIFRGFQTGLLYDNTLPASRAHLHNTLVLLVSFWRAARAYLSSTPLSTSDINAWLMFSMWHYTLNVVRSNTFAVRQEEEFMRTLMSMADDRLNQHTLAHIDDTILPDHQKHFMILLHKVYHQCKAAIAEGMEGQGENEPSTPAAATTPHRHAATPGQSSMEVVLPTGDVHHAVH